MGLDWNPGNKPKPGFEAELDSIIDRIEKRDYAKEPSGLSKLFAFMKKSDAGRQPTKEDLLQRFHEISETAFETLKAPRVGHDDAATRWAKSVYPAQNTDMSEEEWLKSIDGLYVASLIENCDGVPRYSNGSPGGYVEPYSFRGDFLRDCVEVIGLDLVDEIYQTRKSAETVAFGKQLLQEAEGYAAEEGLDLEYSGAEHPDPQLDIVLSAARWCQFWGERGHFLEAYC